MFGNGLDNWHPVGYIGHENTIHDVQVVPMGGTVIHHLNITLEVAEIGG